MDLDRIRALYDYNRWANAKILGAAAPLAPEAFTKDLGSSYRSVRDTLVHILGAEWIWLERWKGTSPRALLPFEDFPTVDSIRKRWQEIERGQEQFLSGATEEKLLASLSYINIKGLPFTYPLWQALQHVVNHSTYHRGQVITMLRQLSAQPVATDFLAFYDERFGKR